MPGPYTAFTYGDLAAAWGSWTPLSVAQPVGLAAIVGAQFSTLGDFLLGPPIWPDMTFSSRAVVGIQYSQQFDLNPAAPPTTFSVLSGTLPPGLALSSIAGDVGLLSGTPTEDGTYTFTIRATNAYGSADKAFTLRVVAAPGNYSWAA